MIGGVLILPNISGPTRHRYGDVNLKEAQARRDATVIVEIGIHGSVQPAGVRKRAAARLLRLFRCPYSTLHHPFTPDEPVLSTVRLPRCSSSIGPANYTPLHPVGLPVLPLSRKRSLFPARHLRTSTAGGRDCPKHFPPSSRQPGFEAGTVFVSSRVLECRQGETAVRGFRDAVSGRGCREPPICRALASSRPPPIRRAREQESRSVSPLMAQLRQASLARLRCSAARVMRASTSKPPSVSLRFAQSLLCTPYNASTSLAPPPYPKPPLALPTQR